MGAFWGEMMEQTQIMGQIGISYLPAQQAAIQFAQSLEKLNAQFRQTQQIANETGRAIASGLSKDARQAGIIFDQYGNVLKEVNADTRNLSNQMDKGLRQSLNKTIADAAKLQATLRKAGMEGVYVKQAAQIRQTSTELAKRLATETKITSQERIQIENLRQQLGVLKQQVATARADMMGGGGAGGQTFLQHRMGWFLSGTVFYGAQNVFRQMLENIGEVETGMVEISRISNDATADFAQMQDELFNLGVEFGRSWEEVQNIALRWSQAGYNVSDALEATKASLAALNTAELDAENATQSLIGIMAQWGLQSSDLLPLIDKLNITADNFSVTTQDLVDGLLRSSSAASVLGVTLEENIAILTAMREASGRTGREVGNALNTILTYIQRPSTINVLESSGIQVFANEARTQFRSIFDIMDDLGTKWNQIGSTAQDELVQMADDAGLFNEEMASSLGLQEQWNDLQRRDISMSVAGTRRRNYLIAALTNWASVDEVLLNMEDSLGYSMEENQRTMETYQAKVQQLRTAFEELAVTIGEAGILDLMKGLADDSREAIETFQRLPEPIKAAIIAMTEYVAVLGIASLASRTFLGIGITEGMAAIAGSLGKVTQGVRLLSKALMAGNLARAGSILGMLGFGPAAGVIAGGSALIGIIASIRSYIDETNRAAEAEQKHIEALEKLANQYFDIKEKGGDLTETLKEIRSLSPGLISAYDDQGQAAGVYEERLLELTEESLKLEKLANQYFDAKEKGDDLTETLKEIHAISPDLISAYDEQGQAVGVYEEQLLKLAEAEQKHLEALAKQYFDIKEKGDDLTETLKEIHALSPDLISAYDEQGQAVEVYEGRLLKLAEAAETTTRQLGRESLKRLEILENEMQATRNWLETLPGAERTGLQNRTFVEIDGDVFPLLSGEKIARQQGSVMDAVFGLTAEEARKEYGKTASDLAKYRANINDILNQPFNDDEGSDDDGTGADKATGGPSSGPSPFQKALAEFEYLTAMDRLSQEQQLTQLRQFRREYELTLEERRDLDIRIYRLETQLETERQKQIEDTLKAIRDETKQYYDDAYTSALDYFQHETSLARMSRDQQIEYLRDLSQQYEWETKKQWDIQERLFSLYSDELKDQQDQIEQAYRDRIDLIETETEKQIESVQAQLDALDELAEKDSREEAEKEHTKKLDDLRKQQRYHELRTGKEHEEALLEIEQQIKDEETRWLKQQTEWEREDRRQELQAQIREIEKNAEEEKKVWEQKYDDIRSNFDEWSEDFVKAAINDPKWFETGKSIGQQIAEGFRDGLPDELDSIIKEGELRAEEARSSIPESQPPPPVNRNYISDSAKSVLNELLYLKNQWALGAEQGNSGLKGWASNEAKKYYDMLPDDLSSQVKNMNNQQLKQFLDQAHTGAYVMQSGAAELLKGERVLSPQLTVQFDRLATALLNNQTPVNQRSVQLNGPLFNAEKVSFEDEQDMEIMSRELKRQIEML